MLQIEVSLIGDQVKPGQIRSQQFALLIESVEKAIESIMIQQYPQLHLATGQMTVGLSNVRSGSLVAVFDTTYSEYVLPVMQRLGSALQSQNFDSLPAPAIDALVSIQSVARKNKCSADFATMDGQRHYWGQINPETQIRRSTQITLDETLYGTVIRVGGENPPRALIRFLDGTKFSCRISGSRERDTAKALGQNLYTLVGLKGEAHRDVNTLTLQEFIIHALLPYRETNAYTAFERLATIIKPWVDEIGLEQYTAHWQSMQEDGE